MKAGFLGSCLILFGLLLNEVPASAHHSFAAEFDDTKPIKVTGVVTKARWANPHSWLYFDVKKDDGSTTNWGVELGAPNTLVFHETFTVPSSGSDVASASRVGTFDAFREPEHRRRCVCLD